MSPQDMINDITAWASDALNQWETKFIEDMELVIANGWKLTENQVNKIREIYERYVE